MGRTPMSGGTAFRFLPAEVADMEKALEASNGATPVRAIVEGLADKFSNSSERNGQRPVQWKQVWNWFQNRRHAQKAKSDKLKAVGSGGETPPAAPKAPPVAGTSAAKKTSEPVTMDFEAKSARDGAWYDVSAFIDKRKSESGEPEVKVRFAGFGSEEDEWVNIANAVRQRSLPCETSECVAVLPGDLILCFQEGSEQALYFDADILDVQRRRHDVRGCRCRFWVRYRHDQTEEVVPLRKVCRRPETEQRLQQARDASAASSKLSNKDIAIERALNAIPNLNTTPQIPPTTPATPVTPPQPSSAFNATPNLHTGTSPNLYTAVQQGASISGLQPMQPIPMQSMSTPDTTSSIHQQAAPSPVAPTHSINVLQAAAVSSSQGPTPSVPIATQSTTQQMSTSTSAQQNLPSIESSITRQLTISVPAQQAPPNSAGVGLSVSGSAHQEPTAGAPVVISSDSVVPEQRTVASTAVAETSKSAQPMEVVSDVSLTPEVDPAGPSTAAPVNSSAANTPMEGEKSSVSIDLSLVPADEPTRS